MANQNDWVNMAEKARSVMRDMAALALSAEDLLNFYNKNAFIEAPAETGAGPDEDYLHGLKPHDQIGPGTGLSKADMQNIVTFAKELGQFLRGGRVEATDRLYTIYTTKATR